MEVKELQSGERFLSSDAPTVAIQARVDQQRIAMYKVGGAVSMQATGALGRSRMRLVVIVCRPAVCVVELVGIASARLKFPPDSTSCTYGRFLELAALDRLPLRVSEELL